MRLNVADVDGYASRYTRAMSWDPPDECPAGHSMRYPNAKVSWVPCDCARADGRPRGHRYVMCLTCKREWREGDCDYFHDGYRIPGRGRDH